MRRVAVLVPVFNNLSFTKKCISVFYDLLSANPPKNIVLSVVVIDDGSTDGTSEWIKSNFPEVVVLEGDGNLWWSGGVNMGAKYVLEEGKSDFVLLWNNDIVPAENYLSELDKLISEIPVNRIAGSKIYKMGSDKVIWSYGGIFNPKTGKKYMPGLNENEVGQFNEPLKVDWLPGMGTLIPISVIRTIGYWDAEHFPQYHGDSDFTFRATLAGIEVWVYPQLRIWNNVDNSGLVHQGKLKVLLRQFVDTKSQFNWKKNFFFYRLYATSPFAYLPLLKSYFLLVGGFVKWKLLGYFGIVKK